MRLLTLTPDLSAYVVALVAALSLSCAPTAALLQSLWRSRRTPSFRFVYAGTLLTVSAAAVFVLRLPGLTQSSWSALAPALAVGLGGGELAFRTEGAVHRALRRRPQRPTSVDRGTPFDRRPVTPPPAAAGSQWAGRETLALLIGIAALEEVLYRGVLVDLSLELPVAAAVVCIAASVLAFSAAHVYWGWIEMLAKLPLGLAALGASLPFEALAGAIAAHVFFNTRSWLAGRRLEESR